MRNIWGKRACELKDFLVLKGKLTRDDDRNSSLIV